jgi:hypothetical protein
MKKNRIARQLKGRSVSLLFSNGYECTGFAKECSAADLNPRDQAAC